MRYATPEQKAVHLVRGFWEIFKGPLITAAIVALTIALMGVYWVAVQIHNQLPRPYVSGVRTDPAPLLRVMPDLGPLTATHWRWRDEWWLDGPARSSSNRSFMDKRQDVTFEGFGVLSRKRFAALLARHEDGEYRLAWDEATEPPDRPGRSSSHARPSVPAELARYGPQAPIWLISWQFPKAPKGRESFGLWLDARSGAVFFRRTLECPEDRTPCDTRSF